MGQREGIHIFTVSLGSLCDGRNSAGELCQSSADPVGNKIFSVIFCRILPDIVVNIIPENDILYHGGKC